MLTLISLNLVYSPPQAELKTWMFVDDHVFIPDTITPLISLISVMAQFPMAGQNIVDNPDGKEFE